LGFWGKSPIVGCKSKNACPESCTIHVEFLSAIRLINKQQVHESPVSVAERNSQPSFLHDPSKNLIRFARITELVLGSPGEQLLHLLRTSYATGQNNMTRRASSRSTVRDLSGEVALERGVNATLRKVTEAAM